MISVDEVHVSVSRRPPQDRVARCFSGCGMGSRVICAEVCLGFHYAPGEVLFAPNENLAQQIARDLSRIAIEEVPWNRLQPAHIKLERRRDGVKVQSDLASVFYRLQFSQRTIADVAGRRKNRPATLVISDGVKAGRCAIYLTRRMPTPTAVVGRRTGFFAGPGWR